MDKLISPFHSSFIPVHHIQDNIIVGQEILHKIKKARGRRVLTAMKTDMEKAYDRIKWSFVHQVISNAGFDVKLINLIM